MSSYPLPLFQRNIVLFCICICNLSIFVHFAVEICFHASSVHIITKTRLYNFDPLKPQFYIVKLGFTGVNIIFLISVQNIDCGYTLEPPRRGGSDE